MDIITFGWFCKLFKSKELSGYPCKQLDFLNDVIEGVITYGDESKYIKRIASEATANRVFNSSKDVFDNYSNAVDISIVEDEIIRLSSGFTQISDFAPHYDIDLKGLYKESKKQTGKDIYFKKVLGDERYVSLMKKEDENFLAELLIYLIKIVPNNKKYVEDIKTQPESVYDKNGMYEVQHRVFDMLEDYMLIGNYQRIIELGLHREFSSTRKEEDEIIYSIDNLFPYINGLVGLFLIKPNELINKEAYSALVADFGTNWSIPSIGLLDYSENILDLKFIYESFVVNGDIIMDQNIEPLEKFFINGKHGKLMYAFGWFNEFKDIYGYLDQLIKTSVHKVYMTVEMPTGFLNAEKIAFANLATEFWEKYNSYDVKTGNFEQKIIVDGRGNRFIRKGFMVHLLIDYTPILDVAGSNNYKKVLTKYISRLEYLDKNK